MGNIQQEAGTTTGKIDNKFEHEKPIMRDLFREFFEKMQGMSEEQKISLAYTNIAGKKPFPGLNRTRKLNRILYEQEFGKKIQETNEFQKKAERGIKIPYKLKQLMKKSKKVPNKLLILYYRINGNIDMMLVPLFGTNMIIINNKPYEVDPRAFFRFLKHRCMSFKEIDRRPISNLDYDEIRKRGDSVDSDEFLIKAAMRAMLVSGTKKPINKGAIVIGIIVLICVVGFLMMNKGVSA